jgi:hypothetical protein
MKQVQKEARRYRRPVGRQQEPSTVDLRDPDIVRAHQITRRNRHPATRRIRSGGHSPDR